MCKKLIDLFSFILVLNIAGNASAELVAHWSLDEGSGTTAVDLTGNGHDGTIGGTANWVAGQIGLALDFDGSSTYIDMDDRVVDTTFTLTMWLKPRDIPYFSDFYAILHDDAWDSGSVHVHLRNTTSLFNMDINGEPDVTSTTVLQADEWYHFAVTVDTSADRVANLYVNGVLEDTGTGGSGIPYLGPLNFGAWTNNQRYYHGLMDDIRIYDHVLSEVEVLGVMTGEVWPYAWGPSPADGALHLDTWVTLSWKPGGFAVSHDVYLGDNFDDVNDGTGDTFRGNQGDTFFIAGFPGFPYPDGLVPGTTYYWRIDEVNDADPNSPWKGDVWSFWIPPKKAYDPDPPDNAKFIDPDVTLSWTAGFGAKLHTVYLGDNFDDVDNATGGTAQGAATYTPGPLAKDTVYYWRVDEFDAVTTHKGDVWSFKTLPDIPITDPNLIAWWKLDEGSGTTAVDWSGHNNHGTIGGTPDFVPGYDGDALDFDGSTDYIDVDGRLASGIFSLTMWIRPRDIPYSSGFYAVMHDDAWNAGSVHVHLRNTTSLFNVDINGEPDVTSTTVLQADEWYHFAVTVDTSDNRVANLYVNGVLEDTGTGGSGTPYLGPMIFGAWDGGTTRHYHGLMDDIRIYNKVLTVDEVQETMRGDPLLAWNASPENNSIVDVKEARQPLTWSPGDKAAQHDVYFGTDKMAVDDADTSDTTGIYRGRQTATSYTVPEGLEWGSGPYYWRIDEYNNDDTISKGRVWSFTVADYLIVDDFEAYNDLNVDVEGSNRIFMTWMDGYDTPTNGSQVGYTEPPFCEQSIVNSGRQSMPLFYDNSGPAYYSEVTLPLTEMRDWTEEGVKVLTLWFRGNPTGFIEEPAETYTMAASGVDIWDMADEFRYAFKQLSGAGSISAQVLSVQNTDGWAKAGVMIRETLEPGSKHAFVCVTPSNGVASQGRPTTGGPSVNWNQGGITAPHWVRLERDATGRFTAYHSADGVTWESIEGAETQLIAMSPNVYIGLALTSHNADATCVAEFSDVKFTGTVSPPQWTHQAIGATMASNDPEPMYVAVSNANGPTAVVYHDNPNAALIDAWTQWNIDMEEFSNAGVVLTNVDSIAIGFGNRNNPQVGGSGLMFIDDIRLYRPVTEP